MRLLSRRLPCLGASLVLLAALASPALAQPRDVLAESGFARDPVGRMPSRPWIHSPPAEMVGVVRDHLPGASAQAWVKIVDGNAELSTHLRHPLPDVREGTLRFRLVNARPGGTLGFYIGTGGGSSPQDRVYEMKISGSGNVSIGGRGDRANAGFTVEVGVEYEFYIEFGIEQDGSGSMAFGYIHNDRPTTVATAEVRNAEPCTILRITTDRSNADSMFFVANVRLEVP